MVKATDIATLAAVAIGGYLVYSIAKSRGWVGPSDYTDPTSGECVPAWNVDIQGLGKPCCSGTHSFDPGLGKPAMCIPNDATDAEIEQFAGEGYVDKPAPIICVGKYDPRRILAGYKYCEEETEQPSIPDQPDTAGGCIAALDASSMTQLINYVAGLSAAGKEQWRGYWLTKQPGCASMINAIADTY